MVDRIVSHTRSYGIGLHQTQNISCEFTGLSHGFHNGAYNPVNATRRCAMRLYQMADAVRYEMMNTEELRETFLIEELFQPGEIEFAYVDLDRTVIGSAVPTNAPLKLVTEPELRADYFLERRELGVLNIGGVGSVTVE